MLPNGDLLPCENF